MLHHQQPVAKRPLCRDIARSGPLNADCYTDPEIFLQEREQIFFKSWKYAGHESELPRAGSYITTNILDQKIFLIRGDDGQVRGFYNVCQHRAHELLNGQGDVQHIRCPYHAWTYSLDGHLHGATRAGENIRDLSISLTAVNLENIHGFYFINLAQQAAPLRDIASVFPSELHQRVRNLGRLKKSGYWVEEREANWKLIVENDVECYHCHVAHPYLSSRLNLTRYRCFDQGACTTHRIDEDADPDCAPEHPNTFTYWFVWPDTEARVMPGPTNFAIYTMEPLSTSRTRLHYHHFVDEAAPSDQIEEMRHNPADDPTVAEDVALVESVQRGLNSRGYRGQGFVSDPNTVWTEHSVHHFQLMVADALGIKTADADVEVRLRARGESIESTKYGRWISKDNLMVRTPTPAAVGTIFDVNLDSDVKRGHVCDVSNDRLSPYMTIIFQ